MTEFGVILNGVIFRPTDYHRREFELGNHLYLKGKVTEHPTYGLQFNQPKKVKEPSSEIVAVYKKKGTDELIDEHFTTENFQNSGLPQSIVEQLYKIHKSPNEEIGRYFQLNREFDQRSLYALKFTELYYFYKNLQERVTPEKSIKKLTGEYKSWTETLPFKLTGDQQKAIKEVAEDLKGELASRRVVVGDVGSGKTMVILASIVIAYPERSILMAPTSILAEQLYNEAKEHLPKDIKIALVTGKTSKKEDLTEYDLLVGTHALLYREIGEASLLIVDEQHRFGTVHRKKLQNLTESKSKKGVPHFIQLSATPIPRTQAMINSDFVGVSLIEETPFKKNIYTKTIYNRDFKDLISHINSEIDKKHQILIIYPLVEESENIDYQSLEESKQYWFDNFDDVYMTHGKDKSKDEVLKEFRTEGKILLSTTVVEVGISLPELTTIVIVGAERLGLATLHQLRGRVSRTGLQGYCFLYTKSREPNSIQRLKKFEETKSGFDIASLDLHNRKSGDLIEGVKQSGETFQWFNVIEDEQIVKDVRAFMGKA